ncbi:unnamed protein product [Rotaria magnacalcarata]|uniref:Uncharacterized protein n=1 Tax=Rotaria magnacalcarata TaxID=392030 RepID=A0A820EJX2_9BILA|nr:unnamed protein product [Rotaria magnacalcarata]CAF4077247.1 unnamed protein product [Rotaria magnacalcarata]CAF4248283.1 unnamed protein product [Rotaria magnacalcarata]
MFVVKLQRNDFDLLQPPAPIKCSIAEFDRKQDEIQRQSVVESTLKASCLKYIYLHMPAIPQPRYDHIEPINSWDETRDAPVPVLYWSTGLLF